MDQPRPAVNPANQFFSQAGQSGAPYQPTEGDAGWRPTETLNGGPAEGGPAAGEPVAGRPIGGGRLPDEPPGGDLGWAGAPIEPADDDLDLLADSNRRLSKLTVTLIAGILAAVAFGGGVLVQKHYGGSTTAASGNTRAGAGGGQFARQFGGGAGGYGNFGGGGAGAGGGTGTGAGGAAAGGGTAAAADTPAVVGQVVKVSGTTVTVKNFAGKVYTVKVPADTAISLSTSLSLTGLKAGTSVAVVGKAGADGSITASSVTARK